MDRRGFLKRVTAIPVGAVLSFEVTKDTPALFEAPSQAYEALQGNESWYKVCREALRLLCNELGHKAYPNLVVPDFKNGHKIGSVVTLANGEHVAMTHQEAIEYTGRDNDSLAGAMSQLSSRLHFNGALAFGWLPAPSSPYMESVNVCSQTGVVLRGIRYYDIQHDCYRMRFDVLYG